MGTHGGQQHAVDEGSHSVAPPSRRVTLAKSRLRALPASPEAGWPGRRKSAEGARLPAPGQVIGSYRIVRQRGEGGMGVVWEVEHVALGKRLAMKVLRRELFESEPDSPRRFLEEARAAARIRHGGIVDVSDFGTLDDGRPYLVMELLSGSTLDEILDAEGALAPSRALAIARGVADALAEAHACGVIHGDLTPANIFVIERGRARRVVLVDFGAAQVVGAEASDGPAKTILGTPCYISPELARGGTAGIRSDIYALGVVLFEMLTGDVPFRGDSVEEILRKHVFEPRPEPMSPIEPLGAAIGALVVRAMAKRSDHRHASAAELSADIERVEQGTTRKGWRRWLP